MHEILFNCLRHDVDYSLFIFFNVNIILRNIGEKRGEGDLDEKL